MRIDQERADDERDDEAWVAHVMTVSVAIAEHSKGEAGTGELPCPVCHTGTLSYAIADTRRAVAVRCSTSGCVAFLS